MHPQKSAIQTGVDSETYPLGESGAPGADVGALAFIALSHTPLEHRLYLAMLAQAATVGGNTDFSTRELMMLTSIRSSGTVRRGLDGLITKLSVERFENGNGNGNGRGGARRYSIHSPVQILERRRALGMEMYPSESSIREGNQFFERAMKRVVAKETLSRREVQVALCCVEGLTNAAIGVRLEVTEQTVKFHLRHIFVKFGVKRRAELISRLLT
jgi:DNA-binding CsgD family transcriptional regulator